MDQSLTNTAKRISISFNRSILQQPCMYYTNVIWNDTNKKFIVSQWTSSNTYCKSKGTSIEAKPHFTSLAQQQKKTFNSNYTDAIRNKYIKK